MDKTGFSKNNIIASVNSNVSDLSDDEKNVYLKEKWSIEKDTPFVFIGQIKVITTKDSNELYMLSPVYSIKTGENLYYPDSGELVSIYLGTNIEDKLESRHLGEYDYVKYTINKLNFSPEKEQKRRKTNFLFSETNIKNLEKLHKIPKEFFSVFLSKINDEAFLEQWVIEQKHDEIKNISERIEKLKKDFEKNFDAEKSRIENEYKIIRENEEKEVEEIKSSITSLENKQKNAVIKIENSRATLSKITQQKDNAQKELEEINQKINKSLSDYQSIIENNKNKILLLAQLGIIMQEEANNLLNKDVKANEIGAFTGSYIDAIDIIQSTIYKRGSFYSKDLLRNFCALLNTHDIIFFAGDSGIGKTNLVKRFAEAIGGVSKIIPVKPNWTSPDDLLGYYNPIEKRFISTPFLDAIYEAQMNPNKLYLVCLDEMNLARIEYYFADFLSKLEDRSENITLELYSEKEDLLTTDESFELIEELSDSIVVDDSSLKYKSADSNIANINQIIKDIATLKQMKNKRSRVKIPQNIRFIGTLNVDDTTYYLSPKILDRVHIIKFDNPIFTDKESIKKEINFVIDTSLNINPNSFFDPKNSYPNIFANDDDESPLVKKLVNLSKILSGLGISFGPRVIGQSLLYANSMKKYGEKNEDIILNNLLLQKVFPRLLIDGSDYASDGSNRTKLVVLEDLCLFIKHEFNFSETNISCISKLEQIINRAKNSDSQINYWIK